MKIHIKLDTGMSRLGFLCAGGYFYEGVKNVVSTCRMPNLDVEGVYTHFTVSDLPTKTAWNILKSSLSFSAM